MELRGTPLARWRRGLFLESLREEGGERAHGLAGYRDGRRRVGAVVMAATVQAGEEEDTRGAAAVQQCIKRRRSQPKW
jgi:hypothetical protein